MPNSCLSAVPFSSENADPSENLREQIARAIPPRPAQRLLPCEDPLYYVWKRCFDVPASLLLLVLLSPVFALVTLLVRMTSPGKALYAQQRGGYRGQSFGCLKFRTMHLNAEEMLYRDRDLYARYVANGFKLDPEEDPRITRVGRFLRASSLDELPQLINVLRGEMSLVGPRPLPLREVEQYGSAQDELLSALPGITGLWQISGRSSLPYPERAIVQLEYGRAWSILLDLKILLLTVPAVLRRSGAV